MIALEKGHAMAQRVLTRRMALQRALLAPVAVTLSACSSAPKVQQAAATPDFVSVSTSTATTSSLVLTPTPVATAEPTATPEPAASPTPGDTATSAQSGAAALNAQNPGRAWDFALRPLLFQIDNAPAARPQSGLSSAYVVYETLAEGGITRFTALIVQQALAQIGNVRSARLVDIDLTQQWDGVLLHVGASTPVAQLLQASGIAQIDFDLGQNAAASYRTADRIAPYNLYTSLARLRPYLTQSHIDQQATTPRAFPVGALTESAAPAPGASFTIPYGSPSTAGYVWNAAANGYLRSTDGQPVSDANTGKPIVVNNVVAHFAQEIVTNIIEDIEGSHSLKFVLTGTGKAILLRDGKRVDLTWRRDRANQLMTYAFSNGTPAAFAAGNVWVSFVPDTMQVE